MLTPDFVLVDHRNVGWREAGGAELVNVLKGLVDLAPDADVRWLAIPRLSERAEVAVLSVSGHGADGGDFELTSLAVMTHEGDRLSRAELFGIDDMAAAISRFEELCSQPQSAVAENEAIRCIRRNWELVAAGKLDELVGIVAPNAVFEDRRAVVGGHRFEGRDAVVPFMRPLVDSGTRLLDMETTATRGRRLALMRLVVGIPTVAEVECLQWVELDDRGLVSRAILFDTEDLDAAYDELDASFGAGEARESSVLWSLLGGVRRAYRNHDLSALTDLFSPDFEWADHRAVGWGTVSGTEDAWRLVKALVELSPDIRMTVAEVDRIEPWGCVFQHRMNGHTNDGGDFEIASVVLATMSAGRIDRIEYFEVDDRQKALMRFGALRPPAASSSPSNTAARRVVELHERILDEDQSVLESMLSKHVVTEDRRPLVGYRVEGRDEVLRIWGSIRDIGVTEAIATPIATRGDRLVLSRNLYRGPAGEAETLGVIETDDEDLFVRAAAMDTADLDAAYDELDAWYFAGEGAAFAPTFRRWTQMATAYRTRDWAAMDESHTEDFEFVDHRPVGWGTTDWDGYVRIVKSMADLSNDVWFRVVEIYQISPLGLVARNRGGGHDGTGGEWEAEWVGLATLEDDRLRRIEYFALEDRGAALARFDELARSRLEDPGAHPGTGPAPGDYLARLAEAELPVLQVVESLAAAYNTRDWPKLESVLAGGCKVFDERPTGWGPLDRTGFLERTRELAAMAPDATLACVAVHRIGDRGAVCTYEVTGTVPGGGEFTIVFETTAVVERGRLVELHMLPEGQLAEATRRLGASGA
jgi:ketosteroid isomerase-like protein